MSAVNDAMARGVGWIGSRLVPFADAATEELPLGRLLRLSLFQVTVGMAIVMVLGTLNRVMIVELGVSSSLVAIMISLPLIFAPFRAIIGFRSDTYRSYLGWRRTPFLVFGSLLQFGGFSIMPFALILLSGDTHGPMWIGQVAAGLAFLLVGIGMHTVQTTGLALATDLAPPESRPKVVALLCMMLLAGMVISALVFGALLANFSEIRLIQVVQGAAVMTLVLNLIALVKQEMLKPDLTAPDIARPSFKESWQAYLDQGLRSKRRLLAIATGTAAFSMADVLLEPFGGQILHLPVGTTTALTATLAIGSALGLWLASHLLDLKSDPYRVSGFGAVTGLMGFVLVIFSEPLLSWSVFAVGTATIGFGGGLFAHGMLTASMGAGRRDESGLSLGAWGSAQATAAGLAIALGGVIRDGVASMVSSGAGDTSAAATGYAAVYCLEIALLFITLIVIGPLVGSNRENRAQADTATALPEFSR